MNEVVKEYIEVKTNIQKYFGCPDDYFIKPLPNYEWSIYGDDGIFFLTYWDEQDRKINAMIVKKDCNPLIYKAEDYTMVIALDCVKIAFILSNDKEK